MSVDREVLRGLLAKIEEAKGPDRRLDYEVFTAFAVSGQPNPWDPKVGHFYTASIDAALALVERVLPYSSGYEIIQFDYQSLVQACLGDAITIAPTAPLAILGSLLKALIALSGTPALAQGGDHEA